MKEYPENYMKKMEIRSSEYNPWRRLNELDKKGLRAEIWESHGKAGS